MWLAHHPSPGNHPCEVFAQTDLPLRGLLRVPPAAKLLQPGSAPKHCPRSSAQLQRCCQLLPAPRIDCLSERGTSRSAPEGMPLIINPRFPFSSTVAFLAAAAHARSSTIRSGVIACTPFLGILLLPSSASAEGLIPIDLFQSWLVSDMQDQTARHSGGSPFPATCHQSLFDAICCLQTEIESLGPWGPVIFVLSVAAGEMIPLLPTQPLAIAGGLLFGAVRV